MRPWARGSDDGPGSGDPPRTLAASAYDLTPQRQEEHGSNNMNRSELVAALADRAEVTRKDADAVLAAFADTVGEVVAKGDEKVTIPGFLTFERTHRAARTARNPQTG